LKVFVAGATGAVGVPLVRQLIAAGHEVVGLSRTPERAAMVGRLGAVPAVADAMDASALTAVVRAAEPDAMVHVLTALPKTGPRRASRLEATNALRTTGTANLLEAAMAAGARRLVAQSIILAYGHGGDHLLTESRPLADRAPIRSFREGLAAILSLEEQVLGASRSGRIEGIVLRYGLFYGPDAGTDYLPKMLRRRLLPLPGGGHGSLPGSTWRTWRRPPLRP
jgi:nucleoside-diphosphate-sugar epimerase